jgi:hypothetical protein
MFSYSALQKLKLIQSNKQMKQTNLRPQNGEDKLLNARNDMNGFTYRRVD